MNFFETVFIVLPVYGITLVVESEQVVLAIFNGHKTRQSRSISSLTPKLDRKKIERLQSYLGRLFDQLVGNIFIYGVNVN